MGDEPAAFLIGDVFTMRGPSVPRELWDKFFRVDGFTPDGEVILSKPYIDAALTQRYYPAPPSRSRDRSER